MNKDEKKAAKLALKESKREAKKNRNEERLAMKAQLLGGYEDIEKNKDSIIEEHEIKKLHKSEGRKVHFKEFPIKLLKEANKLKTPTRKELGKKFVTVLIFITVAAIIFFSLDLGLVSLFRALSIIK
ncbi:preprotein translocase subunit SecE [Spiroplasma endosymbiont of Othius punctulatus]|uniref:preprotein translocase subunit SecE n=1 Tax=Spiroplasma endosymbiont of Othius punctulatus TaxID=3066289 RepID=UPI0030CBA22A